MIRLIARIEMRLAAAVSAGLLFFSLAAGFITYASAFAEQIELAGELQQQLVRTVQTQAEVAAFAVNEEIATGVVEGLMASSVVKGVRLRGGAGMVVEDGFHANAGAGVVRSFTLYSPVDRVEVVGTLDVLQNDAQVEAEARRRAINNAFIMFLQLAFAAFMVFSVARSLVTQPVIRLAEALATIRPGGPQRLPLERAHANDEFGRLTQSTNALLEAAARAIDEVERQRDQLEILATHDQLTGLPLKRLATDRFQMAASHAVRTKKCVALLFIDLDAFKAINDSLGHAAGDVVLKEVALRLVEALRESDTAARVGGDEFMVILSGIEAPEAAYKVGEKLVQRIAEPIEYQGQTVQVGASIGVALFPEHGNDLETLRQQADAAMYAVKRRGKKGVGLAGQPVA